MSEEGNLLPSKRPESRSHAPLEHRSLDRGMPEGSREVPRLVRDAGPHAVYAYENFLFAKYSPKKTPHTHRAYSFSVHRFLEACESHGLKLRTIRPLHVSR